MFNNLSILYTTVLPIHSNKKKMESLFIQCLFSPSKLHTLTNEEHPAI